MNYLIDLVTRCICSPDHDPARSFSFEPTSNWRMDAIQAVSDHQFKLRSSSRDQTPFVFQELQDMQSRRHQDNFTPSQKAVVPLNRYDEADRVVARALYAFNGQTARELSFRKGDLINVRRQIDANWYEGELHGRVGLFPYNYVEVRIFL